MVLHVTFRCAFMALCDFIIRDYKTEDAQALAEFFNESEEGWPGGFTGGVEITPEYVRESIEKDDNIAVLLAFHGEKVVGFLKLTRHWATNDASYVKLLNVHPSFRGRGIGTALLKEALSRTVKAGLDRMDLHTWSGNERAIRLYKKLGFKWVPNTNVYMQNYLPYMAKFPPFKKVIAENPDALYNFEKKLSFAEDGVDIGGRRVFVYEWKEYGFALYADPLSWKVCGVVWPEGRILLLSKEEVLRGIPYEATLELENRGASTCSVALSCTPSSGEEIEVSFPYTVFELKRGEKKSVRTNFRVRSGVREIYTWDEPGRHIVFKVEFNGISTELGLGFRDFEPLNIENIFPHRIMADYNGEILVSLRSKVKEHFSARLVNPLDKSKILAEIKPLGGCMVNLKPSLVNGDVFSTEIEYTVVKGANEYSGYKARVRVPIVKFDKVSWFIDEHRKEIRVHAWGYDAKIRLRGGRLDIYKPDREIIIGGITEAIGPPLWPNPLERLDMKHRVEEKDGVVIVTLSSPKSLGGIAYEKRIVFHPGLPGVELYVVLRNTSNNKLEKIVKINGWLPHWYHDTITLPLKDGLVSFRVIPGETAPNKYALPAETKEMSETWVHNTFIDGSTLAVLWPKEDLEKMDFSWGRPPSLQYNVSLVPGEEKKIGPIIIVPMKLGVEDVRRIYASLKKETKPVDMNLMEEPLITSRPDPVLLGRGEKRTIELVVKTFRSKKTLGKLQVNPLKDLKIEMMEKNFVLSREQQILKIPLTLTAPDRLGAWNIFVKAQTSHRMLDKYIPVVVYRGSGKVRCEVSKNKAVLDNGYLKLSVDARYAGTVYSLVMDGKENLYSPYPETKLLEWLNPWFGGIRVRRSLGSDDKLWREKWDIKRVSLGDVSGIQVSTRVESEDNKELNSIEILQQYLTWPESNILAIRTLFKNTTNWLVEPKLSYYIFTKPGGELAQTFQIDTGSEKIVWKRFEELYDEPYVVSKHGFAALMGTEKTAILVSGNKNVDVGVMCMEKNHGCHFFLDYGSTEPLKPGGTATILAYLVFTDNKTPIEPYYALKKLQL